MNTQLYIFDLDGTLVDSFPELERAFSKTLAELSLPPPARSALLDNQGMTMRAMLASLYPNWTPVQTENFRGRFAEIYSEIYLESKPFPGADEMMKRLGKRVAVVTNKPRFWAQPMLSRHGWAPLALVCPETPLSKKPCPSMLLEAARRLKAHHGAMQIVSVGDTKTDEIAAASAQLPFVGVSWSPHTLATSIMVHSWQHIEETVLLES